MAHKLQVKILLYNGIVLIVTKIKNAADKVERKTPKY